MGLKRRRSTVEGSAAESVCTDTTKRQRQEITATPDFSDELLLRIFAHLDAATVARVDLVSRRFQRISRDEVLWRSLYARDYAIASRRRKGRVFPVAPAQQREADTSSRPRTLGLISQADTTTRSRTWRMRYQIRSNWHAGQYRAERLDKADGRMMGRWHVRLEETTMHVCDGDLELRASLGLQAEPLRITPADDDLLVLQFERHLEIVRVTRAPGLLVLQNVGMVDCLPSEQFSCLNKHLATLSVAGLLCTYRIEAFRVQLLSALKGSISGPRSLVVRQQGTQTVVSVAFVSLGILSDTITLQQLVIDDSSQQTTRVAYAALQSAGAGYNPAARRTDDTLLQTGGSLSYVHPYLLLANSNGQVLTLFKVHSTPDLPLTLSTGRDLLGTGASLSSCGIGRDAQVALGLGKAGLHVWDMRAPHRKPMRLLGPTHQWSATVNGTGAGACFADGMEIIHIADDRVVLREAGGSVTFHFTV